MKIAFCGASGTGKTTLATWLAEELGIPFNPVGSRSTAKDMGFESPYDVDKACHATYQYWINKGRPPHAAAFLALTEGTFEEGTCRAYFQRKLQLAKVDWENNHDDFVSDRSTVDDFVYCALHNVGAIDETYLERAKKHLADYDLIFFTPVDVFINCGDDPNRVKDLAYHRVFELLADGALINWLGDDWNEKVVHVTKQGIEARRELCWSTVAALGERLRLREKKEVAATFRDVLQACGIDVPIDHIMEWSPTQMEEVEKWQYEMMNQAGATDLEAPEKPIFLKLYPSSF